MGADGGGSRKSTSAVAAKWKTLCILHLEQKGVTAKERSICYECGLTCEILLPFNRTDQLEGFCMKSASSELAVLIRQVAAGEIEQAKVEVVVFGFTVSCLSENGARSKRLLAEAMRGGSSRLG